MGQGDVACAVPRAVWSCGISRCMHACSLRKLSIASRRQGKRYEVPAQSYASAERRTSPPSARSALDCIVEAIADSHVDRFHNVSLNSFRARTPDSLAASCTWCKRRRVLQRDPNVARKGFQQLESSDDRKSPQWCGRGQSRQWCAAPQCHPGRCSQQTRQGR